MSNPFTVAATSQQSEPLTERQRSFLRSILMEKAALENRREPDLEQRLDTWLDKLSKHEASQHIDTQLQVVEDLRSKNNDDLEGFWELPDGRICKVQKAVYGSGRPYGKVLDTENGGFNYTPGLIPEIRSSGVRLTLQRAQELGHLYGMCVRCGATLTDEGSIAAGIGPVCATKF